MSDLLEFREGADFALWLDENDPLSGFRQKFHIPQNKEGREYVYFCGNSLGLQPKQARQYVLDELDDWAHLGVEGHMHARHPWMPYHEYLTEKMAGIVGASPIEVVVMNSLTVNLHLLLVSFYRPTAARYKILVEKGAFPSDQYAVRSQALFHAARNGGNTFDPSNAVIELEYEPGTAYFSPSRMREVFEKEGSSIALVLLGNVNYYSGQAFDMKAITELGHRYGCIVGFDLAHGAGNLRLNLNESNVDFAAWCGYKYLNSGPGALSGVFVHERHAHAFDLPRFAGWWGHDKESRFQMPSTFKPLAGAEGWQLSNPPILAMASMRASLDIFEEAGMDRLREKSVRLSWYMEQLLNSIEDKRISIITPSNPEERGCQLSIRVQDSDKRLFQMISNHGVIADWREPDVVRIAPVPLYNTYSEVHAFASILKKCLSKL